MKLTQLWCGSLLVFFPAIAFAQWPGTGDAYVSNASSSAASANNATLPFLVASRPNSSLGDPQFVVIAACRWSWRAKTELADRNGKVAERTPRPPMAIGLGCADISTAVTRRASPRLSAQNSAIKRGSVQETT